MGQILLQDGIGERGAQEQIKNMEENVEYSYEVPQYISEMKFDVGQFPWYMQKLKITPRTNYEMFK